MYLNSASSELEKSIHKYHNENPKTRNKEVDRIKEWLSKQPHLPNEWKIEDKRILTFLRGANFSLESCKRKLDMYFTVRTAIPEFFSNRNMFNPDLKEIFDVAEGCILPELTPEGQRVIIARARKIDFETPNIANVFKIVFIVADVRIEMEPGCLNDVYIFDINFPLLKHFLKVSPLLIKKMLICIQDAYPIQFGKVHIINAPSYIEFIINSLKPFLNETLRNCIEVHTKIETLYDFLPKEIMPEDYGGKSKPVAEQTKLLIKTLEDYTSWFQGQENLKSEETQRPGKRKHEDLFGFEGSFRELNID